MTNPYLTTENPENPVLPIRAHCEKCRGRTRNPEINGLIYCLNCLPARQKRPPTIVYNPIKLTRLHLQYKIERDRANKTGALYTYTQTGNQYPKPIKEAAKSRA